MSMMNRFDVYCTEEVLKTLPSLPWETANNIARVLVERRGRHFYKWQKEFLKEEEQNIKALEERRKAYV